MIRVITLLAALMLGTTAFASAASADSEHASWEAKKLEKIVDHCEAHLAKADDAAELDKVSSRCLADIDEFFKENSNVEVSPELAGRFAGLLFTLGVPPDLATKQGWDLKGNTGG